MEIKWVQLASIKINSEDIDGSAVKISIKFTLNKTVNSAKDQLKHIKMNKTKFYLNVFLYFKKLVKNNTDKIIKKNIHSDVLKSLDATLAYIEQQQKFTSYNSFDKVIL